MRRFPSSPRHRPIAREPVIDTGADDLSTWTSTASITTMELPGTAANVYSLVVDVTNVIDVAAKADVDGLRFRHESGVRLAHKRTPSGRIFLIGNFHGGHNTIDYFWGKSEATQPGLGFPSADEALSIYRIGVIFENGAPFDITPNAASFLIIGSPTIETYALGQSMKFTEGSYIEISDPKVRSEARNSRSLFVSMTLAAGSSGGRVISWYNRLTAQRGFQLWMRSDGLEFYVSDDGAVFQRWLLLGERNDGANAIGASWNSNVQDALLLCNDVSEFASSDFGTAAGPIFDSNEVYIIGGTKIPGEYFGGTVRAVFERFDDFKSPDHFQVWRLAWEENGTFWGEADRTPDSIDVPDVSNVPVSSEVNFASKEVTGITSGTAISVDGAGNPTYSVGSSFSSTTDLKAKGSSSGLINPGNWISTHHTSASANLAVQESSVTVGTVTSTRRSTTVAAAGTPLPYTPGAPANYTVTSVSGLVSAFNSAKSGEIIEIATGDYRAQGKVTLENRDFRSGAPVEIRSASIPFRGYLPSEGGLLVADETRFTSGSGGSEFSEMYLRNIHGVIFTGLRIYQGDVGKAGAKWHAINALSCTNLTFQNMKCCGFKPLTAKNLWAPDLYRPDNGWYNQGRAAQFGVGGFCTNITIKKSLFHWWGDITLYIAATADTLIEDCVFCDNMSDHMGPNGRNQNFTSRRNIFGRTWGRKSDSGGISHNDHSQNTTKTQPGWLDHTYEYCIFTPSDNAYPHIQSIFYECDNYPAYPRGTGLYVTNCFVDSRVSNTIYSRPGDKLIVTKTTVLQNQFGGLNIMNAAGTDSLIDTLWHNPVIQVASTTANGKSFGNNVIDRCVYFSSDFTTGDQIINSTAIQKGSYNALMEDFPEYNGPLRSGGPALPLMSAAAFKPLRILNDNYVLVVSELRRAAPKVSASIHPNQKGQHYGCSELFQSLGALP